MSVTERNIKSLVETVTYIAITETVTCIISTVLKTKIFLDHRLKGMFVEIEKLSKGNYKRNLMVKLMRTIALNKYF